MEYIGCFIPWNAKQCAGPSGKHFIRDPADHPKHTHPYTVSTDINDKKRKQAKLPVPSKASKVLVMDVDTGVSSSQKVFVKSLGKTKKQHPIMSYATNVGVSGKSANEMAKVAKEFCLSVVHASCKKMESNSSAILHYQTGVAGMLHYFKKAEELLSNTCPDTTLPPPVELQLNSHNIVFVQRALLDSDMIFVIMSVA